MSTENSKRGLAAHSKSRTSKVKEKFRDAMHAIEIDIEQNDGIYPFNAGRVTQAEVCRRAGAHKVTLQNSSHKTTTRETINSWIKAINSKIITGKKAVRKTVTIRADDWKARYLRAVNQTNLYHLQMVSLQSALRESKDLIAALEEKNLQLQTEVSKGRVVRITKKSGH
jgi:hypothetical protein